MPRNEKLSVSCVVCGARFDYISEHGGVLLLVMCVWFYMLIIFNTSQGIYTSYMCGAQRQHIGKVSWLASKSIPQMIISKCIVHLSYAAKHMFCILYSAPVMRWCWCVECNTCIYFKLFILMWTCVCCGFLYEARWFYVLLIDDPACVGTFMLVCILCML